MHVIRNQLIFLRVIPAIAAQRIIACSRSSGLETYPTKCSFYSRGRAFISARLNAVHIQILLYNHGEVAGESALYCIRSTTSPELNKWKDGQNAKYSKTSLQKIPSRCLRDLKIGKQEQAAPSIDLVNTVDL